MLSLLKLVPWWAFLAAGVVFGAGGAYFPAKWIGVSEGRALARAEAVERTNKAIEGLETDAEKIAAGFRACLASDGVWDNRNTRCREE